MASILFINIIRYLILSFSLIGLGFHLAQCALLTEYQHRTSIPSWISAGHWQYLAWYITFGFSLLCGLAICTHATCCKRSHILRGDKCLGIANMILFAATILGNTFITTQEPWTNGIVEFKEPAKGFITYCNLLDEDHDASFPLLFQRCLLIDGIYVTALTLCTLWIILVLCTIFIKLKRSSLITRVPTERPLSERKRSKALDTSYHPYARKHSTSFEEVSFSTSNTPYYKYATPIAPHHEKVQLPASYDHVDSQILQQQQHPSLSRHHPPTTIPGGWVEYSEPMAVSPYYHEAPYQNTWYPNNHRPI